MLPPKSAQCTLAPSLGWVCIFWLVACGELYIDDSDPVAADAARGDDAALPHRPTNPDNRDAGRHDADNQDAHNQAPSDTGIDSASSEPDVGTADTGFDGAHRDAGPPRDGSPPSGTLGMPTGLRATALTTTSVTVTWNAPGRGAEVVAYQVYRDGEELTTTASTTLLDEGLLAATEYRYAVAAVDSDGHSSVRTDEVRVTTPGEPSRSCPHDGSSANVVVSDGAGLQAAIDDSDGGVIWVAPGTYSCVRIESRNFTEAAPLILRKDPSQSGEARFVRGSCYFPLRIIESTFVAVDGFVVDGGGIGVYVERSDHIELQDLEVMNTDQEAIQVRNDSSFVDISNCHLHDTGVTVPKWAECIYVGTGGSRDFPDHTHHVWIEDNEIHHCGAAEGINIKAEVFQTTVRGNRIHDIRPGTSDQYNQAALTVEGESRTYLNDTPREIWVERNDIRNVESGPVSYSSGNAMMVGGTGVYVVDNVIDQCDERGIYGNGWGDLGLFLWVHGNRITNVSDPMSIAGSIDLRDEAPPSNPLAPQTWYCH